MMKQLQPQLPFPEYQTNRTRTPVLAALRHPSTITYSSLKHHCSQLDAQMPPSHTTPIMDPNHPNFTIQFYHPTKKHPNPSMPTYTAITTTLLQLPTHNQYTIQISDALPLQGGLRIDATALKATIEE
eukprot:5236038-Karenia_brevis.AAC.1